MQLAYETVKDSGKHKEYETGAKRDTRKGKGRYDLLSSISLHRLAVHMENGAEKYAARNWEKGIPMSRSFDSAVRHLYQFLGGDRSEDHLAAAMWNAHCMIHTEEMVLAGKLPEELNDLPNQPEAPKKKKGKE